MPAGPPPWHLATITTMHTASTVSDLGVVGVLSLAVTPFIRFGRDRALAQTAAKSSSTPNAKNIAAGYSESR